MIINLFITSKLQCSQSGRVFLVFRGSKVFPKVKNGQKKCPKNVQDNIFRENAFKNSPIRAQCSQSHKK